VKEPLCFTRPDKKILEAAMLRERNYLFALIGVTLVLLGFFAAKPEGVRSAPDTLALYAGLACCFVQMVIWLDALIRNRKKA
jgi:hypothetical protein